MKFDFDSPENQVLLNPRMNEEEGRAIRSVLADFSGIRGHFWMSTSGTTGMSKWVALSREALAVSAEAVNRHLTVTSGDSWLQALPSFHVGGLGIWLRARLSGSGVVDFQGRFPKWDPGRFATVASESQATLSALVPTQIHDLVQGQHQAPKALRAVVVGGGALAEELYGAAHALGWNLLPSYGLTECGSQVATASLGSLSSESRSKGLPRLEILSHIEARKSPSGLLEIKSPALLSGYAVIREGKVDFADPKENGWFRTEDRIELEDRYLKVLGRDGNFFKMSGESVDFSKLERDFEALTLRFGLGANCVLLPMPDERTGTQTHLVCLAGVEVQGAVEEFNGQVLPFERIREIYRVQEIPRSALGKVLRTELIQKLLGQRE